MEKAPTAIANGIEGESPPPGFTSVAMASAAPESIRDRARREVRQAQVEAGRRQHRRGAAAVGQCAHARLRNVAQVIRGARAELGCELGAAGPLELVRVEPQQHPGVGPGAQNAPALVYREYSRLTEDVAEHGQAATRDLGDHLLHHDLDVPVSIVAVVERHLVGAEERRPRA